MKRILMTLLVAMTIFASAKAMGYDEARIEAKYLTDKMAYELGLSPREYDRAYRANLEYLLSVDNYDDLYAASWRSRNSALRIVLGGRRWNTFVNLNYFYRPLAWHNGVFVHRIYDRYPSRHMPRRYVPRPRVAPRHDIHLHPSRPHHDSYHRHPHHDKGMGHAWGHHNGRW
ncbi:MAG: hypothetical protein K6A82_00065 [Prevotella sp.]|nr:hypothetical protein [Prevotella sp.]